MDKLCFPGQRIGDWNLSCNFAILGTISKASFALTYYNSITLLQSVLYLLEQGSQVNKQK